MTGERVFGPNDVVFTGTVTAEAELPARVVPGPGAPPNRGTEVYYGGFVYTFDVDTVVHGDPGDARVYTPSSSASCGRDFQVGAPYLVYAQVVDPDARWIGGTPTVPLATGLCSGGEQLGLPNPLIALTGLGISELADVVIGLALVGGVAFYVFKRRRSLAQQPRQ